MIEATRKILERMMLSERVHHTDPLHSIQYDFISVTL